jgi:putative endonuclease
MFFVYAIRSEMDGRIYVGMCSNMETRLKEHNTGKTKSTKGFRPWILIYKEEINTRVDARNKEKYLKSGVGKEFLKSLVP